MASPSCNFASQFLRRSMQAHSFFRCEILALVLPMTQCNFDNHHVVNECCFPVTWDDKSIVRETKIGSDKRSAVVEHLESNSIYQCRVYGQNGIGNSCHIFNSQYDMIYDILHRQSDFKKVLNSECILIK